MKTNSPKEDKMKNTLLKITALILLAGVACRDRSSDNVFA
jgi:hypothetical protein